MQNREESLEGTKNVDDEINKIEQQNKDLDFKKQDFKSVKNGWVHYKNGKKKIKLRKFIADRAKVLSNISKEKYSKVRQILIDEFNKKGLIGVNQLVLKEIGYYKDRFNSNKEKLNKIKKDEGI